MRTSNSRTFGWQRWSQVIQVSTRLWCASFCAVLVLAACGGGAGSKDLTCSDFTYQEDAQDAFRSGASQLDGDKDGIACENLPHRPATPSPTPTQSPVGLWKGLTSTNRTLTGLVLPGGLYYVFYSRISSPSTLGGVAQGTGSTTGASFSSSGGKDFNVEGLGLADLVASASIVTKQSLNGSFSYSTGQSTTFTTSYSSAFELVPMLASVAGTFTGQTGLVSGTQTTVITVSSAGAISSISNGCTMSGTASPRPDANAYTVTVSFGPSPCAFANQTVSGLAYYDASTKRLFAAVLNSSRTAALTFLGTKP